MIDDQIRVVERKGTQDAEADGDDFFSDHYLFSILSLNEVL